MLFFLIKKVFNNEKFCYIFFELNIWLCEFVCEKSKNKKIVNFWINDIVVILEYKG